MPDTPPTSAALPRRCPEADSGHRCDLETGHDGDHLADLPDFKTHTWASTSAAGWEVCRETRYPHTCNLAGGHAGPHHCPTCPHDPPASAASGDLSERGHRPAFGERLVTPTFCSAYDGDTGLRCLREKGHEPPHRCEIEWEDDDGDPE